MTRADRRRCREGADLLEEAGYIEIRKYFKGKIPATGYRITPAGHAAFSTYWQRMRAIQQSIVPEAASPSPPSEAPPLPIH